MLWDSCRHSGLSITATPEGERTRQTVGRRVSTTYTDQTCLFILCVRWDDQWRRTCVAPSVAHVGGNEAPLVCGRVVKLHGREVTGPVVSADHVQQSVDRTDA